MKRSVLVTIGLALLVGAVAFAQAKPDFSGTWAPDPAAEAGAGARGARGGGMMGGGPMTVTQTANELIVERTMGQATIKMVYKLDGTESVNEMAGRGAAMKSTSVAKWDGARLVITTKSEGRQGPVERVQTWYLNPDGTLTIEQPGQGGEVRKTVYKKS